MADGLKPAVRKAVRPVGATADTMSIGSAVQRDDKRFTVRISRAEREAINAEAETELTPERTYQVIISEIDLEMGSCKVTLGHDTGARYDGKITDPALSMPMNPYVVALAQRKELSVRAKALVKGGDIVRLYISDTITV